MDIYDTTTQWAILIPALLLGAYVLSEAISPSPKKPAGQQNSYLLPSVILGACILGAAYFVSTRPQPSRQPQEIHIRHSNGLPGGSFTGR